MNIAEKFKENKRVEEKNTKNNEQKKLQDLVNRITTTLSDAETIEAIENYLVENGALSLKDFGCLCQGGGFCDWQKGLDGMLKPIINEWKEKGVRVYPSLSLEFRVLSGGGSSYNQKKTIEEIRKWNKSEKK